MPVQSSRSRKYGTTGFCPVKDSIGFLAEIVVEIISKVDTDLARETYFGIKVQVEGLTCPEILDLEKPKQQLIQLAENGSYGSGP